MTQTKRIYDGALSCGNEGCGCGCPVADLSEANQTVTLHDPAKPDQGKYTMTVPEFNLFLQNAKPVPPTA